MGEAGRFRSRRERGLWVAAVVAILAIYASLYFVRAPTEWLRERNLLRLAVGVLFALAAAAVVVWAARRRPRGRELAVLGACGLAYLIALAAVERHEERLHFLEYGLVAGLVYGALRERWRDRPIARWGPAIGALAITGLAGWGDEGIQALLPNRVYELRDAGLNLLAAVLIVASMRALELARAGDRRR